MRSRPLGITILAVAMFVNVATYAVIGVLYATNRPAYTAVLEGLSPGGSGPLTFHESMGGWRPLYYSVMTVGVGVLGLGLWRLRNWARIVVLLIVAVNAIGVAVSTPGVFADGSAAALSLFALRVGLAILVIWYLVSPGVRLAFRTGPSGARRTMARA